MDSETDWIAPIAATHLSRISTVSVHSASVLITLCTLAAYQKPMIAVLIGLFVVAAAFCDHLKCAEPLTTRNVKVNTHKCQTYVASGSDRTSACNGPDAVSGVLFATKN